MEKTANGTPLDWFRFYFSGCNWFVQLNFKPQSFPVYLLLTFYLFALYLENVMFLFTATLLPYPSSLPSLYCPPSFLTAYWKFSTGFLPISDKICHMGSIKSVCLSVCLICLNADSSNYDTSFKYWKKGISWKFTCHTTPLTHDLLCPFFTSSAIAYFQLPSANDNVTQLQSVHCETHVQFHSNTTES